MPWRRHARPGVVRGSKREKCRAWPHRDVAKRISDRLSWWDTSEKCFSPDENVAQQEPSIDKDTSPELPSVPITWIGSTVAPLSHLCVDIEEPVTPEDKSVTGNPGGSSSYTNPFVSRVFSSMADQVEG